MSERSIRDLQFAIFNTLLEAKKPLRASEIARNLRMAQNHVDYHLVKMVSDGVVQVSEEGSAKFYVVQELNYNQEIVHDFEEMLLASVKKLLPYMDLSQSTDKTEAVINNFIFFLKKIQLQLEKHLKEYNANKKPEQKRLELGPGLLLPPSDMPFKSDTFNQYKLTNSEKEVLFKYLGDGYVALRNGAPDFLMLKYDDDGMLEKCIAIEVKTKKCRLTPQQTLYREILENAGIEFRVERIK